MYLPISYYIIILIIRATNFKLLLLYIMTFFTVTHRNIGELFPAKLSIYLYIAWNTPKEIQPLQKKIELKLLSRIIATNIGIADGRR